MHPVCRRVLAIPALLAGLAIAGSAQAALVSPLSVTLWAPGGTTFGDPAINETASVDTSVGLVPGLPDPANLISNRWMLPPEYIQFSGDSILIGVAAGDQVNGALVTGYLGSGGDTARYEIGVAIAGRTITGFTASAIDGYGGGMDVQLVNGNTELDFGLDQIAFDTHQNVVDPNGYHYATFRIDLQSAPIGGDLPEPASLALVATALTLLGVGRSKSRRA